MTVPAGTRLGPYEVVAPLGAGGMGEVYRARDPRLEREVAIKVLPAELRADADALARFRREALAVAALAHPNLLALFDVGSEDGTAYAVTELLEGATLRERLARGPLPPDEALEIALQLASGLAAAHDKGIVHRDLKPENVFVTHAGHVKILDFGLARRTPVGDAGSSAMTVTGATAPGTILGTMGYTPPEQLRGEPAGPPADVFAWGLVTWEMLTGQRAFAGATWAEVAAAILTTEPLALAAVVTDAPAGLDAIVQRCLAREPSARFATARELREALVARDRAPAPAPASMPRRSASWLGTLAQVLKRDSRRSTAAPRPRVPLRERAIAMLDFDNLTGDRALDWIARGLPELLGTALARSPDLDVYDPQRLQDLRAGRGADAAGASPFEPLRDGGVGRAVVGSMVRAGSEVRLLCRVVDVASGRVMHADSASASGSDDLFQLAAVLVPKLQTWLEIDLAGATSGDQWLREITTSSSDAYRLYLRGHEAFLANRWRESAGWNEQSLALDPDFVAARVDLTGCYWNLGDEPRTRASLDEARRLRDRASPRERLHIELIEAVITFDAARLIRVASSLGELYPEKRFFRYLLARGYFTASEWQRCLDTLEPLLRERWTWNWTYVLAARCHVALQRLDRARRVLEQGMSMTQANPEVAFELARVLSGQREPRAARELLDAATRSPQLAETPEYEGRIRLELGRMFETDGDAARARSEYVRAAALLAADSEERTRAEQGVQRLPE